MIKMKEVKLISSTDNILIGQICNILKENNIPFEKRTDGSGEYLNIAMGQSNQETSIIINEEEFDRASELIEVFSSNEVEESEEDKKANEENQKDVEKYKKMRRNGIIILFFIQIVICIISVIVASIMG